MEEILGTKKLIAAAAGLLAGALALSACTPPPAPAPQPTATDGTTAPTGPTSVSVMWNQPLNSLNNNTSFGNATANANIVYMTQDNFAYYDKGLNIVPNTSYGTYEKVSDDPLTVKMTLADTASWNDGVPVTVADVILAHGALSGLYNTVTDPEEVASLQNEDGTLKPNDEGKVYFDSNSPSLSLITEFPTVEGDKTASFKYDKVFVDWEQNVLSFGAGLPAHIIGKRALGVDDPTEAKAAVVAAFQNKDNAALSKIANVWNQDWNFKSLPSDPDLLVTSGPYKLTDYVEGQYLTVTKNEAYKGANVPNIDAITVRYNEDPMAAVQALENSEVQLISPQATADILTALQALSGVSVYTGDEATYEHVDLTFNNGGPFDPASYGGDAEKANKVREAFLKTIPRQAIMDTIIKPINPNAAVRNSFTATPGSPSYDPIVAANGMSTKFADVDVEGAKALLAEVGVSDVPVKFLYGASNVRRQQEFRLIKESADSAGFNVIDNGSDDWGTKLGDKTYDASLFGWQSTGTGVSESDANFRTGKLPNNFGGYSNAEVDKLFDQLQTALEPDEQVSILSQVETHLVNDNFGITIFQFPGVTAYQDTLTGVDPIAISPTIFWNFWEWTIAA